MFYIGQTLCIFLHIRQPINSGFYKLLHFWHCLFSGLSRKLHHYNCCGIAVRGERPKQEEMEGWNTGNRKTEMEKRP